MSVISMHNRKKVLTSCSVCHSKMHDVSELCSHVNGLRTTNAKAPASWKPNPGDPYEIIRSIKALGVCLRQSTDEPADPNCKIVG